MRLCQLLESPHRPNNAFLNDLASKIGAGPPKAPVGLVKKPTLSAETAQDGSTLVGSDAKEKQSELAAILKKTVPKNEAADGE